jgi:hypothetical protein
MSSATTRARGIPSKTGEISPLGVSSTDTRGSSTGKRGSSTEEGPTLWTVSAP